MRSGKRQWNSGQRNGWQDMQQTIGCDFFGLGWKYRYEQQGEKKGREPYFSEGKFET